MCNQSDESPPAGEDGGDAIHCSAAGDDDDETDLDPPLVETLDRDALVTLIRDSAASERDSVDLRGGEIELQVDGTIHVRDPDDTG